MRQVTDAIRDLTVVTQQRQIPDKPDRRPMDIPRRPQVMTFTRSVLLGNISATNVETTGAYYFTLDSLPSYTDFTSLFDQYRIAQVTVRFIPVVAPFGASTTAALLPDLHTVIDYDDAVAPATVDVMRQYGTHSVAPNQVYFERVLTPRYAVASYSGTFTSYSLAPVFTWIDSNSPSVQYYGVKWGTTSVSVVSGSYVLYNVEATYVVQCKSFI
jgi:hypothetical protein